MLLQGLLDILIIIIPTSVKFKANPKHNNMPVDPSLTATHRLDLANFFCFLNKRNLFPGSPRIFLNLKASSGVQLALILLMAGDVCTNPGPNVNFGFANVRAIKTKFDSVIDFIKINKVDIFCINETWLSPSETDSLLSEITPPTHNLHSKPRIGKRGGGVAIYIDKQLESKSLQVPHFETFEAILASVNFTKATVNFVSLYRPPFHSLSIFC